MTDANKKKLGTICVLLGTFFCPFGFDILFKWVMNLTGSYWATDIIFYLISGTWFGIYFYVSKINPLKRFFKPKS